MLEDSKELQEQTEVQTEETTAPSTPEVVNENGEVEESNTYSQQELNEENETEKAPKQVVVKKSVKGIPGISDKDLIASHKEDKKNPKTGRRDGFTMFFKTLGQFGTINIIVVAARLVSQILTYLSVILLTLYGSMGVAKAIDPVSVSNSTGGLIAICIISALFAAGFIYLNHYLDHYINHSVPAYLRSKVYRELRLLGPAKLQSENIHEFVGKVNSNIALIKRYVVDIITQTTATVVVSFILFIIIGALSSWYMSLILFIGMCTLGIGFPWIYPAMYKGSREELKTELVKDDKYFQESLDASREIYIYKLVEDRHQNIFDNGAHTYQLVDNNREKDAFMRGFTAIGVVFFFILGVIVAVLVNANDYAHMTNGEMIIGIGLTMVAYAPVIKISSFDYKMVASLTACDELLDLLNENPEITDRPEGVELTDIENVEIKGLTSGDIDSPVALTEVRAFTKLGDVAGISSSDEAELDLFTSLLLGFKKKDSGTIMYNDHDIDELSYSTILSNVTLLAENTQLFAGTISENLRIAKPSATDEEISEACKKAGIDELILTFEKGYDTLVETLGTQLTVDVKQKLGLARCYLSKAKLVLLREITKKVSKEAEKEILTTIIKNKEDKAYFLISSDSNVLNICNHVYKLDQRKAK